MDALAQHLADLAARTDEKVAALSGGRLRGEPGTAAWVLLPEATGGWCDGDRPVVSVGMTLVERPALRMLMLFADEARAAVATAVAGPRGAEDAALANSVLQEIGNIFGTAVANALATHLGEAVRTSTPEVAEDMAEALVGATLVSMPEIGDRVLALGARLRCGAQELPCRVHLFLEDAPAWRERLRAEADATPAAGGKEQ